MGGTNKASLVPDHDNEEDEDAEKDDDDVAAA